MIESAEYVPSSADVAVVGGGAVGLAVAWRAAQAGLSVAVLDPSPGRGASHVAAGMLAPVSEAQFGEPALLQLNLESLRRYPGFIAALEEATGHNVGFIACGTLLVARDADDLAWLERELRFREQLGLPVQRLSASECRRLEPALAPGVRGGMLAPDDHQVDPRRLVAALLTVCARSGVPFVRAEAEVVVEHERAVAVRSHRSRIDVNAVVLAAGAWSARVAGVPQHAVPPVRPVKGQILRLRCEMPLVHHVIRGVEGYAVCRRGNGEVVCGATAEERGFDTSVTAGAVYEIMRNTRELIPDVGEMAFVEASAGLRPATPDNLPCIGGAAVERLFIATGHYRNGILLAPVTAEIVTALVCSQPFPVDSRAFSPLRFGEMAPVVA